MAEKNKISERHAYRRISLELEDGKLKKHVFSDRTVVYGIDEFGPPTMNSACATQVLRIKLGFFEWWEKKALRKELERWIQPVPEDPSHEAWT